MSLAAACVRLAGRRLCYAEYGDPRGAPVFYFHGLPGSRLDARVAAVTAMRRGVRLIAPDRPGFGLSDPQLGRRILDWPADVRALAEALDVGRFAVLGVSGGAPYAAACAYALPECVTVAGIAAGMGPLDRLATLRGMAWMFRLGLALARRAPRLAPAFCATVAGVLRGLAGHAHLGRSGCAADRRVLARPEIAQTLRESFLEAARAGTAGIAHDLLLHAGAWGFALDDVRCPVHLWHGEADLTVPAHIGRVLAAAIPGCRAHFYAAEGHFSLPINRIDDIFATLLAAS